MLDGLSVTLVDSLADAKELLDWLEQQTDIAIDTETTGLDWWTPDFTRLVQFGNTDTAYAVGVREWWQLLQQALHLVRDRNITVAMHNSKFDMHALEAVGLPAPEWHNLADTLVMDHLCYPIRRHGLKAMGSRVYGKEATVGDQLLKKRFHDNGWSWDTVPVEEPTYWAYGCMDTILTARFARDLYSELTDRKLLQAYEREMATTSIAYRMECRGLRIDLPYTERLREEWECEKIKLRLELETYGVANPNSKADVVAALRARDKWDPYEFTETGEPKLDKTVLSRLTSDIAPRVLRYKRLEKWTSAYLDHFLSENVNGYVHPTINTLAARTGRMSIQRPALQTLPAGENSIRRCILPPEGHSLWATDYDAQELRVLAHLSGDPGLLDIFRRGVDPHTAVAAAVYGEPVEPWQRKRAKNVQFARAYGAGAFKIAETAGVTLAEIEHFINVYNMQFPGVDRFMRETETVAQSRAMSEGEPYIITAGGRWINTEPDKLYTLVNYAIQGSCADLLKMKLVELDKVGLADNVVLPVHDELLFSFPEEDLDSAHEARHIMEEYELFSVPLTCHTTGPLTSWGDDHDE